MGRLTKEFIESIGYVRVNNSTWRRKEVTLQNTWITEGGSLVEKLSNSRRAYRLCYKGKFKKIIETVDDYWAFFKKT